MNRYQLLRVNNMGEGRVRITLDNGNAFDVHFTNAPVDNDEYFHNFLCDIVQSHVARQAKTVDTAVNARVGKEYDAVMVADQTPS